MVAKKKNVKKVKEVKEVSNGPEDANQLALDVVKASDSCDKPDKPDGQEEPQLADSVTAATSTETSKLRYGSARGVSRMHRVVVRKAQGKKFKVRCNRYGEPIGDGRTTLESYTGMVARSTIPIDISNWPKVDAGLKDNLWMDIQATFQVPPELRSHVLHSAGVKWRQFKTMLTSNFVMPFVGDKKKLRKPPKKYAFVSRNAWKNFVANRTAKNWMPLRKEQSARVKQRKYPHRLARKGYTGLLEDEVKAGRLEPDELPDRAIMWQKARKRKPKKDGKDGNDEDEELQKIFEAIDDLMEKKERGEFTPKGTEDVLATALKTPDHAGRLRGVGGFVTQRMYFNLPKEKRTRITKAELLARDREREEELERTKKEFSSQIEALKAMVAAVSNGSSPLFSEKASSCHEKENLNFIVEKEMLVEDDDCVASEPPLFPAGKKGSRKCELAVDNIENKVAFGLVLEEAEMNNKIHGMPMPPGCVRVLVDGAIKGDALVPVPVRGEIEKVHEAVGSHLAWPKQLVIFSAKTKKIKRHEKSGSKAKIDMQSLQNAFKESKLNEMVPSEFTLLYKHATITMKNSGMSIPIFCDAEVFGAEKIIYILHENLIALLEYKEIGQAAISAYMAYLHNVVQENQDLDLFAFCDPAATFTLNNDFESYVVNRLKEGNVDRVFLMPHNESKHWILVIIWNDDIYICNPLSHPVRFPRLEKALIGAIKSFKAQTGRGSQLPKVKNLVGSPKQPGGHECGYVVMRYMREIILDKEMTFPTKWGTKTRALYNKLDLDVARMEVLKFIQERV